MPSVQSTRPVRATSGTWTLADGCAQHVVRRAMLVTALAFAAAALGGCLGDPSDAARHELALGEAITSPLPPGPLAGDTETFTWDGTAEEFWLVAGSGTDGGARYDYYYGASVGTAHSTVVTGLPTDGSTIYVTLWYRVGATWTPLTYTYTAASPG